jgi:hypothetical protein
MKEQPPQLGHQAQVLQLLLVPLLQGRGPARRVGSASCWPLRAGRSAAAALPRRCSSLAAGLPPAPGFSSGCTAWLLL